MKVGILGTRGIPNYYGGFEQFAEYFATFLASKGHEVFVYSSHKHPYQEEMFKGVNIIHCKDPEHKIGTAGQFLYDLNCIRDSRKRNFDILLQLGYTSNSIWHRWLPKKTTIVTNMDGLEWRRSKYSKPVKSFLRYAEKLAVRSSDFLIADSIGIQDYLKEKYNVGSEYIAYGAEKFETPNESVLKKYDVEPSGYNMLIARMEPENNIETILQGAANAKREMPFLVIGKNDVNTFGREMTEKFKDQPHIRFLGGIYELEDLNNLRYYSNLYFHGHSVGGTNPSLLEAMASSALMVAHDNNFNRAILGNDACYFSNAVDVANCIASEMNNNEQAYFKKNNLKKIEQHFSWSVINNKYLNFFEEIYGE